MKIQLLTVSAIALTLSGCSSDAQEANAPRGVAAEQRAWQYGVKVSPLKGPISEATPGLVIKGISTSNRKETEGTISFSLPEGAACEGKWSVNLGESSPTRRARGTHPHVAEITQSGPESSDGASLVIRHQKQTGEGKGTCTNGADFIMFYVSGKSLMKDSNGNIYRIDR